MKALRVRIISQTLQIKWIVPTAETRPITWNGGERMNGCEWPFAASGGGYDLDPTCYHDEAGYTAEDQT
jgi:hypothetical protein